MSAQTFVLTEFNSEITMDTSGEFDTASPVIGTYDAETTIDISLNAWSRAFKVTGDSVDILNAPATDIHYFVYNVANECAGLKLSEQATLSGSGVGNLLDGNPAMKLVDDTGGVVGAIDPNATHEQLEYDFVRYIALNLFNTHKGVDLFSNEEELRASIETACGDGAGNLVHKLSTILSASEAAGSMDFDKSPAELNLTYILLQQLLSKAPDRFSNGLSNLNATTPSELPWMLGDIIQYVLTINAATNQHLLVPGVSAIPARTYLINMRLA